MDISYYLGTEILYAGGTDISVGQHISPIGGADIRAVIIMRVGVYTYAGISFGLHALLIGRTDLSMCGWRDVYTAEHYYGKWNPITRRWLNAWHTPLTILHCTELCVAVFYYVSLRYCGEHPWFEVSLFSGNSFHEYCVYTFLSVSM